MTSRWRTSGRNGSNVDRNFHPGDEVRRAVSIQILHFHLHVIDLFVRVLKSECTWAQWTCTSDTEQGAYTARMVAMFIVSFSLGVLLRAMLIMSM